MHRHQALQALPISLIALRRGLGVLLGAALLALLVACASLSQVGTKPGHYRVQRGDTLSQIARKSGRTVDELRRWNKLNNVHQINVGQVLRITPPATSARAPSARPTPAKRASAPPAARKPAPTPAISLKLVRPAQGQIIQDYNGSSSRGLTIANVAGTPVVAAAAGSVMYVGSKLRAYGNLIIIQHDSQHLTVYAHNRSLLVKEGQKVAQGQKIAEMGSTGSNRIALYFELRRNGQPINPASAFRE